VEGDKENKTGQEILSTSQNTPRNLGKSNVGKAHAFAEHLTKVFQPHPTENKPEEKEVLTQLLHTPNQPELPPNRFKKAEVQEIITSLNPKKSSGYDLITGRILKELQPIATKHLTQLFNAALSKGYLPAQWKIAPIILISKPGKPPNELTSYRPISLLPIISKVFEKLLLKRILPMVESLIPNHQFGLRKRHSATEKTHRILRKINEAVENRQYCSAAFLDISQAFDKVWHTGLLYKLKRSLPPNYFTILKS
jgi:hypothetical protein